VPIYFSRPIAIPEAPAHEIGRPVQQYLIGTDLALRSRGYFP
jgi:hypothetical protein